MVNAGMVNCGPACSFQLNLCEICCVLGRILRVQNPIKYKRNREVNPETVRPALKRHAGATVFPLTINTLPPLKTPERCIS